MEHHLLGPLPDRYMVQYIRQSEAGFYLQGWGLGVANRLAPCPLGPGVNVDLKRFGKPVGFPVSNDVQMEVFHIELLVYRRLIGSCYIVVD